MSELMKLYSEIEASIPVEPVKPRHPGDDPPPGRYEIYDDGGAERAEWVKDDDYVEKIRTYVAKLHAYADDLLAYAEAEVRFKREMIEWSLKNRDYVRLNSHVSSNLFNVCRRHNLSIKCDVSWVEDKSNVWTVIEE